MVVEEQRKFKVPSFINPKQNSKGFIASLFILIAILGASTYTATTGNKTPDKSKVEPETVFTPISNNTVVYGYWADKNSEIEAADLNSGKIYQVAELGKDIKKVTVASSNSLIFINKTDDRDHGKEIVAYDLGSKNIKTIASADTDFGIDDYVISPNKKYIAIWEIRMGKESQQLIGGNSRVYSANTSSPNQKNLIYDEPITQDVPVSYPIGVTDSGEIFLDKFKANVGAGWANGMTISNFSGNQKQDLTSMTAGTYSTQPAMSPDGKHLVFAGYDGSKENGIAEKSLSSSFRNAIVNPNTVELINILTKQRTKLSNLSSENIYPGVSWDKLQNKLILTQISKEGNGDGTYITTISGNPYEKVDTEDSVISTLSDSKILTGISQTSLSSVGNLGEKYASSLSSISAYDNNSKKSIDINIGRPMFQFIDIKSNNYFRNAKEIGRIGGSKDDASHKQLQLQTFALKPTLAPKRIKQQSETPPQPQRPPILCYEIAAVRCDSVIGPHEDKGVDPVAWDRCFQTSRRELMDSGTCPGSPLYLYGLEGTKVRVKIQTKTYAEVPSYNDGYDVVLGKDGKFSIRENEYSKISFDYNPALRIIPSLNYGRVVDVENVGKVLDEYGRKLGLNNIEIQDLKNSIDGKINSPYVFVSFYNDEVSKKILPISFNPKPEVYRNIVFYLRPLEAPFDMKEPEFEKIPQRQGFTAVEISHIIDR